MIPLNIGVTIGALRCADCKGIIETTRKPHKETCEPSCGVLHLGQLKPHRCEPSPFEPDAGDEGE